MRLYLENNSISKVMIAYLHGNRLSTQSSSNFDTIEMNFIIYVASVNLNLIASSTNQPYSAVDADEQT